MMNRRSTAFLLGAIILALTTLPATSASAENMSERELKKTLKQADKNWQSGHTGPAVAGYIKVLGATEAGDTRRSNALYAVALTALNDGDMKRAHQLLDELGDAASPAQRLVIGAFAQWAETARAQKQAQEAAEQANSAVTAELTEKLAAAKAKIAELEAWKKSRGKKEKALAECEEKLEKVRKSLVDRSGS